MGKSKFDNEQLLKKREKQLLDMLEELKHLCFGMYAKIIPPNMSEADEWTIGYIIKGISEDLARESVVEEETTDKFAFYRAFYCTAIYFLLAMCNEEDQIFLSLRKLANTFNSGERLPIKNTTFDIMVRDVKVDVPNHKDRKYAEGCLQSYKEFEKYYDDFMMPDEFRNNVKNGVNRFVDIHEMSCITQEETFSEIKKMIRNTSNKVYFTLYQEQVI